MVCAHWLPSIGVKFHGKTLNSKKHIKLDDFKDSSLFINDYCLGDVFISGINTINFELNSTIRGNIKDKCIYGDKSVLVNRVKFSIPNFREFRGDFIRLKKTIFANRLTLLNDNYIINIDQSSNYSHLQESLKTNGGYIIQYSGELISKKGKLDFNKIQDIFECLNKFLSFLNGRRTSAFFAQGFFEKESKWIDYTNYRVDIYKYSQTWPIHSSIEGINESWVKFCELWKNDNDKRFLSSVIHWYIEANNQSGFIEGAIIMAQTALELIYNWLIIEKRKLLMGKDADNISAANKIRLLITQLNISPKIPSFLKELHDHKSNQDAPEIIVEIRNAIVHSQVDKRTKLASLSSTILYQALQVYIWYIELSILYILDFKGKYNNRCSGGMWEGDNDQVTPWSLQK